MYFEPEWIFGYSGAKAYSLATAQHVSASVAKKKKTTVKENNTTGIHKGQLTMCRFGSD